MFPANEPSQDRGDCRIEGTQYGGDAVPFNVAVDEVPDWISKLLIGPHVPRIREFMQAHPEVQVVGSHMAPINGFV